MNSFLTDVKKIFLGQDGSDEMPLDFKDELTVSLKENVIDKAKATLLMNARLNADKLGKDIDKKQIADVSGKGTRVTENDVSKENKTKDKQQDEEKKEEEKVEDKAKKKKKKEEEEKDRKRKEESLRQTMQKMAELDELENEKTNYKQKGD